MKFRYLIIENRVKHDFYTKKIKNYFKQLPLLYIDDINDYFGQYYKPHSHRETHLNIFVGSKQGEVIKQAPKDYAFGSMDHYYFIHAFNCIYDCQYCYLQGYFYSPDLVFFVNHDDIIEKMKQIASSNQRPVCFHAGEYSDSLALTHITKELEKYWTFFQSHPNTFWELRTKSINIKEVLQLTPIANMLISFSLSPQRQIELFDKDTPSLKSRLNAIETLMQKGYYMAFHFDPIIEIEPEKTIEEYRQLIEHMMKVIKKNQVSHISLGVVRFKSKVYSIMKKQYPHAIMFNQIHLTKNNLYKYPKMRRNFLLMHIKAILVEQGISENKIYYSME